ncbi:hypothetical protein C4D60_Mb03t06580 [Musa balbisiana]|uniref:Pterin-binding domain-containing protein n=1 Tax=Musa balbisiana TaxID=52838 RepID=A0A4S8J844_MUSBA|nr:hypothetical protein C4D60_Mb03t06580 [Musa balbisiana]
MAHALVSSRLSSAYPFHSIYRGRVALPRQLIASSSSSRTHRLSAARAMASSNTSGGSFGKTERSKGWRNAAAGAVGSSGSGFPISNIPVWARWILGSLVIAAIPFYTRIIKKGGNIEKVAEVALETVEKLAEVTEKIASDVAAALPEGDSLKEKALLIEKIAEKVEHDAKLAEAIIHEVDVVKEEVDTLVKPLLEKEESEKEIQVEENEGTDQSKAN